MATEIFPVFESQNLTWESQAVVPLGGGPAVLGELLATRTRRLGLRRVRGEADAAARAVPRGLLVRVPLPLHRRWRRDEAARYRRRLLLQARLLRSRIRRPLLDASDGRHGMGLDSTADESTAEPWALTAGGGSSYARVQLVYPVVSTNDNDNEIPQLPS